MTEEIKPIKLGDAMWWNLNVAKDIISPKLMSGSAFLRMNSRNAPNSPWYHFSRMIDHILCSLHDVKHNAEYCPHQLFRYLLLENLCTARQNINIRVFGRTVTRYSKRTIIRQNWYLIFVTKFMLAGVVKLGIIGIISQEICLLKCYICSVARTWMICKSIITELCKPGYVVHPWIWLKT